jgi:chromate reductase
MKQLNVAVLVGSLRKESFNRKIAHVLSEVAPAELDLTIIPIGELAFFNQDLEATPPSSWETFRAQICAADAVLFVTPEYNRSVPAVLKNALDVGSRPYGQSVWDGKPGGVVSVSISAAGGFGANHHLRQSLVFLNIPVLQQPEAYIGMAGQLFDEQGTLINESTHQFLTRYMQAYAKWVARNLKEAA